MALRTRRLGWGVAAIAAGLIAGAMLAFVMGGFWLGDERNLQSVRTAQSSPQVTETVAVKQRRVAAAPKETTESTNTMAPPEVAPSQLRGLNDINLYPASQAAPAVQEKIAKAFDPTAKGRETLPWDLVEPVPVAPPPTVGSRQAATPARPSQPTSTAALPALTRLPTPATVATWLKSKMTEIKGEERARSLLHFELWLEPPPTFKSRLVAVTYSFSSPAIVPQSQTSRDASSGFRIAVGELGCADTITVVVTFDDGRTQSANIDGCRGVEATAAH